MLLWNHKVGIILVPRPPPICSESVPPLNVWTKAFDEKINLLANLIASLNGSLCSLWRAYIKFSSSWLSITSVANPVAFTRFCTVVNNPLYFTVATAKSSLSATDRSALTLFYHALVWSYIVDSLTPCSFSKSSSGLLASEEIWASCSANSSNILDIQTRGPPKTKGYRKSP